MGRNIELYWKSADTAPAGVPLQVLVTDGSSESEDYLLPYPCQLTPDGWVNAATGSRLEVRPTRWKPFVELAEPRNDGRGPPPVTDLLPRLSPQPRLQ